MEKNVNVNQYRKELKPRIMEYAMSQFMTYGIRAVKMDDIAKDLGISKRTMYELFENKEDLLMEGIHAHQQLMDEKMRTIAEKEGATVIDILVEFFRIQMLHASKFNPVFYDDVTRYTKLMERVKTNRERLRLAAQTFFKKGVAEGYFRPDMDCALVTMLFSMTMNQIMTNQLYKNYDMPVLVKNMMLIYLRSFCTIKGVERLDMLISELDS